MQGVQKEKSKVKKGIIVGLVVAIGLLILLLIPFIEFLDLGPIRTISMWIHWPLFSMGFFGESGGLGFIFFVIIWYGIIIGFTTAIVNYIIQIIANKSDS